MNDRNGTGKPVYIYNDKTSVANAGERLVVLRWKASGKEGEKKVAHTNRCVSAPVLTLSLEGEDKAWFEFVTDAVQELQRAEIHKYVTSELDSGNVSPSVPMHYFDKSWLLASWEEQENNSGRGRGKLGADAIRDYFDSQIAPHLMLALAEKQGLSDDMGEEEMKKLEQAVNQFRALMAKLSGNELQGKTVYIKQAEKALALAPDESLTKQRIAKRIESLLKVEEITLADLL